MIEVNLHPAGGKGSRRSGAKLSIPLPAFLRGGGKSGGRPAGTGGRDVWTTIAIVVPAIVVLAVGWLWFSHRSARADLEERLEVATADSARLSDLRVLSDSLISRDALISERLALVQELDDGRFVWPHLLDEISRAMPAYTWLTLIRRSAPPPGLQLQLDGLAANPLAITRFVRNLQDSPYIAEARIMGSQQQVVGSVAAQAFQLMLVYEDPPEDLRRTEPLVENF